MRFDQTYMWELSSIEDSFVRALLTEAVRAGHPLAARMINERHGPHFVQAMEAFDEPPAGLPEEVDPEVETRFQAALRGQKEAVGTPAPGAPKVKAKGNKPSRVSGINEEARKAEAAKIAGTWGATSGAAHLGADTEKK